MKKTLLTTLVLAVAIGGIGLLGCTSEKASTSSGNGGGLPVGSGEVRALASAGSGSGSQTGIWVSGQGQVSAVPDLAHLSLGVEAQAASASEARSEAARAMEEVKAVLSGSGIPEKDIRTSSFSIYPVRTYDRNTEQERLVGYRVSNMLDAKLRDIGKAGEVIDAVTKAGGDLIRIQGISFTVEDPTPYYDQAREKAFAAAKAKAQQLARLGGLTLGKMIYVTESTGYVSPLFEAPVFAERAMAGAVETSISPGEQEISVSVQLGYAIQ